LLVDLLGGLERRAAADLVATEDQAVERRQLQLAAQRTVGQQPLARVEAARDRPRADDHRRREATQRAEDPDTDALGFRVPSRSGRPPRAHSPTRRTWHDQAAPA